MEVLVCVDVSYDVDGIHSFCTHGVPVPAGCTDLRKHIVDYLRNVYHIDFFEQIRVYIPVDSFGSDGV